MALWPPASPGICVTCWKTCAGSCCEGFQVAQEGRPISGRDAMTVEIKVPDIGDFKDVPVIEIHVQPGAKVSVDDPLVSLESDKATMDVPATQAGTVEEVLVKIGDRVSEGVPILRLRAEEAAGDAPVTPPPSVIAQQEPAPQPRQ